VEVPRSSDTWPQMASVAIDARPFFLRRRRATPVQPNDKITGHQTAPSPIRRRLMFCPCIGAGEPPLLEFAFPRPGPTLKFCVRGPGVKIKFLSYFPAPNADCGRAWAADVPCSGPPLRTLRAEVENTGKNSSSPVPSSPGGKFGAGAPAGGAGWLQIPESGCAW